VKSNSKNIKHDLSQRALAIVKVPNLFFIDDSLDYIEKLTMHYNRDNPIENRPSRQTQISIKFEFPFI
jgi:hypothetical protein